MASPRRKKKTPEVDLDHVDVSAPEISLKNTKKELLEAYNALRKRFDQQETDTEPQAKVAAEKRRQESVVKQAVGATVHDIVQSINKLKVDLGGVLNEVMQKSVARAEELEGIEEAIRIESARLAELHDIEIMADSLAVLLQRHAEAEKVFEARIAQRREEVQHELEEAKEELEAEMLEQRETFEVELTAQREAWEAERAQHEAAVKERAERLKRERQREQEEYAYATKLQRQRDEDEYKAKKAALHKELAAQRETQERELADREKAIAGREQELQQLRVEVEAFPQRLDQAVKTARGEATRLAEQQAKIARDLREQEFGGERELSRQQIAALQDRLAEQQARIELLSAQANEATAKVQQIAMQAIEGAAGRKALEAVNEIALQQATRRPDRPST